MISIVIPTMKKNADALIEEIRATMSGMSSEVVATCKKQSAAKNRNAAIDLAKNDLLIMLDDDMTAFYPGWDEDLVRPLQEWRSEISMVAARLAQVNGSHAPQLGNESNEVLYGHTLARHTPETMLNICGSSCIAFYKTDKIRFDENYKGATYEDADFCMQMNLMFPEKKIIINDMCRLVHNAESKGRKSGNNNHWKHNKKYFADKWGIEI